MIHNVCIQTEKKRAELGLIARQEESGHERVGETL
jgi:hypothetical protein